MKIKKIKISNWRSIKDLDINLQDLSIFIGQNNNGKSNVLNSILFFFGEIKHTDQDFNDQDFDIFVEVSFCCLDEYDITQFSKYVSPTTGEIKVRKTGYKNGISDYKGYLEIPIDEKLREENASQYTAIEKRKELPFADQLPLSGRITAESVKVALKDYLIKNRDTIEVSYQLESSQFLGAKNIAQSLFGEILYIPAVTIASSELITKGGSLFNKLYSKVASKITENNPLYEKASAALAELITSMNRTKPDGSENNERPEELKRLEQLIASELVTWRSSLEIEFKVPHVDDAIKLDTSIMVHDGIKTDIDRKGNGLQRSLIFALIKSWATIIKEERERIRQQEDEDKFKRGASQSTYFLFEEPELFLYPQAQRELFISLKALSESDNQVMITTHSSSFLNLNDHKSIAIVHKDDFSVGTTIVQCNEDLYFKEKEKKLFNLQLWFNSERNEAFFAKKVIIFEGGTEKVVIPFLAKKIGVYRYDYTLIDAGSKEAIPIYIHLFNCFKIKYVALYDKDHQTDKGSEKLAVSDKTSLLIEEKIDSTLGYSIVFENDIEEELGMMSGGSSKPFQALQHVSSDEYAIPVKLEGKIKKIFS